MRRPLKRGKNPTFFGPFSLDGIYYSIEMREGTDPENRQRRQKMKTEKYRIETKDGQVLRKSATRAYTACAMIKGIRDGEEIQLNPTLSTDKLKLSKTVARDFAWHSKDGFWTSYEIIDVVAVPIGGAA